jgi:hypothetical protein
MEQAVVRSLVRPMNENGADTLSPMELEALWELARTTEPQLRLRFLAEMLSTEANANQLRNRMEWVVHSAVGLDPQLQKQAERLLAEGVQDPNKSLRDRAASAWVVLGLSETGSASQRASVEVIGQAWASEEDEILPALWGESLLERTEDLVAADAVRLLTEAVEKEKKDFGVRPGLAGSLTSVAGRLQPADAVRLLAEALEKEKDILARPRLAEGLASAAARLEPAAAARLLTDALEKEKHADARRSLAKGLASVADRLEPAEATRVCGAAARLLTQALDGKRVTIVVSREDDTEGLASGRAGWSPLRPPAS